MQIYIDPLMMKKAEKIRALETEYSAARKAKDIDQMLAIDEEIGRLRNMLGMETVWAIEGAMKAAG